MSWDKLIYYEKLNGLVTKYHDRLFIDKKLSDLNVLLLIIFNYDFKEKKTGLLTSYTILMFKILGRKESNFSKCKSMAFQKGLIEKKISSNKAIEHLYLTQKGIAKVNEILGLSLRNPVYIIKSGQKFTAAKIFEEFLVKEMNCTEILLCDTYISDKTLFPFSELSDKLKLLKILTLKIHDISKYNHYKNNLLTEHKIKVEEKINVKLHDRYILGNNKCWTLGASIKDMGNKDTIIRENNEIYDSMKELFEIRWNE